MRRVSRLWYGFRETSRPFGYTYTRIYVYVPNAKRPSSPEVICRFLPSLYNENVKLVHEIGND